VKLSLTSEINEVYLKRLAGERFYERGYKYFTEGAVVRLACKGESILAQVQGTYEYRVRIWIEEKALQFSCDCPVGMDGEFCKHCVATGLTWLAQRKSGEVSAQDIQDSVNLHVYLMAQGKKKLIDMLLDHAEEDELFEQRLHMLAAKKGSRALVVASFRKTIDAAIKRSRFVEYSEMRSYVRGIESVADSMQGLLKDGHGNEVRELAEHALKATEQALNDVDDSDGYMRGVLNRFEQLHHSACKITRPDPRALAKLLFDWEVGGDWEVFYGAAETYADVLGETGLAAYRSLAEAEWEKVRPLNLSEERSERFGRRFRIGQIMERYARATGDIEALVAIKKKDLSSAVSFLDIARIYKDAGKLEEAIAWAECGAKSFPERSGGLNDFLISEYHADGCHAKAVALVWSKFEALPRLNTYQELKRSADRLAQWPDWRKKALKLLRESISGSQPGKLSRLTWPYHSDHSILVEIFLWEQKSEDAWHEATQGGCTKELWLKLAEKRRKRHPAEAVDVYLRYVEPTIQIMNNAAYHEVIELLGKIQELKTRIDHPEEFTALVEAIRIRHKPKRNLMKLMHSEGW
jgi:uncharacterized Zn finger protein